MHRATARVQTYSGAPAGTPRGNMLTKTQGKSHILVIALFGEKKAHQVFYHAKGMHIAVESNYLIDYFGVLQTSPTVSISQHTHAQILRGLGKLTTRLPIYQPRSHNSRDCCPAPPYTHWSKVSNTGSAHKS